MTRTKPEKRQRIIISAKYDEALESVDHRLQEVLETVNALQRDFSRTPGATQQSLQRPCDFPAGSSNACLSGDFAANGGYRGPPSFEAQVRRMAGALSTQTAHLPLGSASGNGSATPNMAQQILDWSTSSDAAPLQTRTASSLPFLEQHPELAGYSLPSGDTVLKLLRLARVEKQRFFIDVAFFDEQQFTDLCREVFFAINPYTLSTWSIVNTGLLYLFLDLKPHRYADLGVDAHQVGKITELLAANSQASAENFRICSEPSLETCKALALLGTFCVKSGQLARAWSLNSAAARMCMDLGLHRLPPTAGDRDESNRRKTFWYIYIWDKGLALTLGRTQIIHQYDVSTERMLHPYDVLGIPGKTTATFQELAVLESEVQPLLFSVSSQQIHQHVRAQRARELRARLRQLQAELSKAYDDSALYLTFGEATTLLEYLLHSLSTVVCSAAASDVQSSESSQQCHACADCTEAARQALAVLVRTGSAIRNANPQGWTKGWTVFLNTFLSLMPFTPYLILVVHIVSEYAIADLDLLASVNSLMEPVAARSSTIRHVFEICTKLYQFAESTVRPHLDNSSAETSVPSQATFPDSFESGLLVPLQDSISPTDSSATIMSLGDFQMMLGNLDVDWRQV
ncbi:hypothetical protein AAE478_003889 [Parahypoxylon ruwenzoriense]